MVIWCCRFVQGMCWNFATAIEVAGMRAKEEQALAFKLAGVGGRNTSEHNHGRNSQTLLPFCNYHHIWPTMRFSHTPELESLAATKNTKDSLRICDFFEVDLRTQAAADCKKKERAYWQLGQQKKNKNSQSHRQDNEADEGSKRLIRRRMMMKKRKKNFSFTSQPRIVVAPFSRGIEPMILETIIVFAKTFLF